MSPVPALKDSGELGVPQLPSAAGERFGFHVSTYAELISPTSAARSDKLLRTEAFA